jgi:DNA-binding transcriptional LysR family regulator
MDKLSSIGLFVKIAEMDSFKEAAIRMGISCSVATRSIAKLETNLGVKLFDRTTRHIELTHAGTLYLDRCKNLIDTIDSIESEVLDAEHDFEGIIELSLAKNYTGKIITPFITNFVKNYAHVQLKLSDFEEYTKSDDLTFDLAISTSYKYIKTKGAQFLGSVKPILVASPEYLAKHRNFIKLDDLNEHRCLYLSSAPIRPSWFFAGSAGIIEYSFRPHLIAHDCDFLLSATLSGVGIACVPSEVANIYLEARQLVPVLPGYALQPLSVFAHVSTNKPTKKITKKLIEFLFDQFETEKITNKSLKPA